MHLRLVPSEGSVVKENRTKTCANPHHFVQWYMKKQTLGKIQGGLRPRTTRAAFSQSMHPGDGAESDKWLAARALPCTHT